MYWKKRVKWLFKREDRAIKILVAASGLLIGLMLGQGLMSLMLGQGLMSLMLGQLMY